jgi:hypothetical protein
MLLISINIFLLHRNLMNEVAVTHVGPRGQNGNYAYFEVYSFNCAAVLADILTKFALSNESN